MGDTRQAAVRAAPARGRLLGVALSLELVWLLLTAGAVVFMAAHLGGGNGDDLGVDPATDRLLVYLVPGLTLALVLALVGARQAVDRRGARVEDLPRHSRLALRVVAGANAGLTATVAVTLYHAEASWVVLGGAIVAATVLITIGCLSVARSRPR